MNEKSDTTRTAFGMSEEEFREMLEKTQREDSFEDKALEQFVRNPKELSLCDKIKSKVDFALLIFLYGVIFSTSIIGVVNENMEAYSGIPIAILAVIGIYILIKDAKNNKENN